MADGLNIQPVTGLTFVLLSYQLAVSYIRICFYFCIKEYHLYHGTECTQLSTQNQTQTMYYRQ